MSSSSDYQTLFLHWTDQERIAEVERVIESLMPRGRYSSRAIPLNTPGSEILALARRWIASESYERPPVFVVICDEEASQKLVGFLARTDALALARTLATAWRFQGVESGTWRDWFVDSHWSPLIICALCLLARSLGGDSMILLEPKSDSDRKPVQLRTSSDQEGGSAAEPGGRAVSSRFPTPSGISVDYLEPADAKHKEQASSRVRQLLSVILGPWLCRVAPLPGDTELQQYLARDQCASEQLPDLSIQAEKRFYERLFRQEFGGPRLVNAFLKMCSESVSYGDWGHRTSAAGEKTIAALPLLPPATFTALTIARLCRRLANCTLEGVAFRCSVLLGSDDVWTESLGVTPILKLAAPIPFNFQFEDEIRDLAEMAQGDDVFLFVSATDGMLRGICASTLGMEATRMKSLAEHSALRKDSELPKPVVFHCREPGHVEIYARGEMQFWHDGFQWRCAPYAQLAARLKKHFTQYTGPALDAIVQNFVYAVADLQDRRRSSIIVLIHDSDRDAIGQFVGAHLRPGVSVSNIGVHGDRPSHRVTRPAVLASVLHLDGAHIITSSGQLIAIARAIAYDKSRYRVKINAAQMEGLKNAFEKFGMFEDFSLVPEGSQDYALVVNRYLPLSRLALWPPDESLADVRRQLIAEVVRKLDRKKGTDPDLLAERICASINQDRTLSSAEHELKHVGRWVDFHYDQYAESDERGNRDFNVWKLDEDKQFTDAEGACRFFIPESQIVQCVWNPPAGMPTAAYQVLREWYDFGDPEPHRHGPGTGTRAAESLAAKMPNSTIIKVSSSGSIKFFPRRPK